MRRALTLAALCALLAVGTRAEVARLPVVADTNLSSYPEERGLEYGGSSRLRLKGIEMFALFAFDWSGVANWEVGRAVFRFRSTRSDHLLHTLGLYSVAQEWTEGTGSGEPASDGASFLAPGGGAKQWGRGPDFLAVSYTHAGTRAAYERVRQLPDDWLEVDVPLWLVEEMRAGLSAGMLLTDESGQTRANNDIYSREQSSSRPELVVEGQPAAMSASPDALGPVSITELASTRRDRTDGEVLLLWDAVDGAIGYRVELDGGRVPALPTERGGQCELALRGLAAGTYFCRVWPVGVAGRAGGDHQFAVTLVARPPLGPLASTRLFPPLPPASPSQGLTLAVHDELAKVHPVTGRLWEDDPSAYATPGRLEPGDRAIVLEAVRGEAVGAMLVVGGGAEGLRGVRVRTEPLRDGDRELPPPTVSRLWYVRAGEWMPEVLLPCEGPFDIPDARNGIEGQRNQSLRVEFLVPRDAASGEYTGQLVVETDAGQRGAVPIGIRVWPLTMPDEVGFAVDLNSYGDVAGQYGLSADDEAYWEIERAYHRLAHRYRANWSPLFYSHGGRLNEGAAPPLTGSGSAMRVSDWSEWDRRFGPLLDGSAFADLPRAGVPVSGMYLPFHESWPSSMEHYRYRPAETEWPALLTEHALLAPPIEEAFEPAFAEEVGAVAAQFREHFRERGWSRTGFQVYLNNKYDYRDPARGGRGTSWWLLDEPMHRDDWLALRHLLNLTRAPDGNDAPLLTRGDISRPQWQCDWMAGAFDLLVLGGEIFRYPELCRDLTEDGRVRVWTYGACNEVDRSPLETVAWAWQAFLGGADGIVPWNTVATDANWEIPDATAILYPGARWGASEPYPSLRLVALRRGAQDAEMFGALCRGEGLTRGDLRELLGRALPPDSLVDARNPEDVRPLRFERLVSGSLAEVRDAVRARLASPEARDGRPVW